MHFVVGLCEIGMDWSEQGMHVFKYGMPGRKHTFSRLKDSKNCIVTH